MQNAVYIIGIGQVAVAEHWDKSLSNLSSAAIRAAIRDAGGQNPEIVYIGNLFASTISHQANLGALLCDEAGLHGLEGVTVEAGEASGAAALHMAFQAVSSGLVDCALVVGVEKLTDSVGAGTDALTMQSGDYDFEAVQGLTPTAAAGLLMQRYMDLYQAPRESFGVFPVTAHQNGVNNLNAMYKRAITLDKYMKSAPVSAPLNLFDAPSYADGAAALVLTNEKCLKKDQAAVQVLSSSIATDTLALHDRADLLAFEAVRVSTMDAMEKAEVSQSQIDLFECWETPSIYGMLSLEAAGFCGRGEAWKFATMENLALDGVLPIASMGGIKARGFAPGATGVYQVLDAVLQLRGQAGENQIKNAEIAVTQALSAAASSAVTHILRKI